MDLPAAASARPADLPVAVASALPVAVASALPAAVASVDPVVLPAAASALPAVLPVVVASARPADPVGWDPEWAQAARNPVVRAVLALPAAWAEALVGWDLAWAQAVPRREALEALALLAAGPVGWAPAAPARPLVSAHPSGNPAASAVLLPEWARKAAPAASAAQSVNRAADPVDSARASAEWPAASAARWRATGPRIAIR